MFRYLAIAVLILGLGESRVESLPPLAKDVQAEKFVTAYFSDVVSGGSGKKFFCDEKDTVTFFSPRSFKVLSAWAAPKSASLGLANIRMDSSNKGGIQITNTWSMSIKNRKIPSPNLVGEAGKHGFCIYSIRE
jgi:hypothetical protein